MDVKNDEGEGDEGAPSSAFSFISTGTAPAAADAAPGGSAFGFLNPQADGGGESAAATSTGSAFSFLASNATSMPSSSPSSGASNTDVDTAKPAATILGVGAAAAPAAGSKKKKRKGAKPGFARDMQLGTMEIPPPEPEPAPGPATTPETDADPAPAPEPVVAAAPQATRQIPKPKVVTAEAQKQQPNTGVSQRSRKQQQGRVQQKPPGAAKPKEEPKSLGGRISGFFGRKKKDQPVKTNNRDTTKPAVDPAAPPVKPAGRNSRVHTQQQQQQQQQQRQPQGKASPIPQNQRKQVKAIAPEENVKPVKPTAVEPQAATDPTTTVLEEIHLPAPAIAPPVSAAAHTHPIEKEDEAADGEEDPMKGTCAKYNMEVVEAAKVKLHEIQENLVALEEQQSMTISELSGARERGVESARQLQIKSQALEQAIADENYEEAAVLETEMTELGCIVNSSSGAVDFAGLRDTLVTILVQKQKLWENETSLHQSTTDTLREGMGEQQEELRSFKAELEAATADESAELAAKGSKIERARQHLDLDRQHLEQQVEKYNAKAEDKSAAFVTQRNKLQKSREEVRQKIEELQLQLDTLKAEDADLTSGMAVQEERIEQAELSLSAEKKRVEGERTTLLETEAQLNKDQVLLSAATTKLNDSTAGLRAKRDALDLSMKQAREHVAYAIRAKHTVEGLKTGFAQFFKMHSVFSAVESVLADEELGELAELKTVAAEKETSVALLLASVQEKQKQASTLRKTLEEIASRIPELQAEKKTAVSGRNFKEAARATAEIKELAAKEEVEQETLKTLTADLATETEAHAEAQEAFDKLKLDMDGQIAEADKASVHKLRAKGEEIRAAIENPANANEEVIKLLHADAEACELMEETLAVKHNLEWTPPEVPLDTVVANAMTVLEGQVEGELLALEDEDADLPVTGDILDAELDNNATEENADGGEAVEQQQQQQGEEVVDDDGDEEEEEEENAGEVNEESKDENEDQYCEEDPHNDGNGAEDDSNTRDATEETETNSDSIAAATEIREDPEKELPERAAVEEEIARLEREIEEEIAKEDDADYERCEVLQDRVDALKAGNG